MSSSPTSAAQFYPPDRITGRRCSLVLRVVAVGCLFSCPIWLWALFFSADQDVYAPSLIFVPLIVLACTVAFIPLWRDNAYLKQLLSAAILARLAAVSLYVWIGVFVYDTSVDAFHYWYVGMQRANDFSVMGWSAFQPPFWNTNLINNICAFVTLAIGNTLPGLFVLFALAALWGGYFFYRAFCIAFPAGETQLYGLLAVLLPSNLFWSSAIGKDALAQLFIGLTVFGFARACHNLDSRSILTCAAGLGGVLAVRPHVAAMLAVAVTLPLALTRTSGGRNSVAKKVVLVPLLIGISLFVINQAGEFVGVETTDTQSGIETIDRLTRSTQIGGSAFNSEQSLVLRIAEAPFLMFRPFPWEVNNGMAAVASLEALALLWFAWKRRRGLMTVLWHWREPFVGFVLAYSIIFSVAFAAATSNFGILVRERIMMVPLLLMLFCVGLKKPQVQPVAPNRKFSFAGTRGATFGKPDLS